MAVSMYYSWEAQGRPWQAALPVRETVNKLKVIYPLMVGFIWILGDDNHLTSNYPQDHTPFSYTGWPTYNPYPRVCAFDTSHQPSRGFDCDVIVPYWVAEAKAGRMPWVKYFIYKERRYDVRNNWSPVSAVGHLTHVHTSVRTDWVDRSIGTWSPVSQPERTPDVPQLFTYGDDPAPSVWISWGGVVREIVPNDSAYQDYLRVYGEGAVYPSAGSNGYPTQNLKHRTDGGNDWTDDDINDKFGVVGTRSQLFGGEPGPQGPAGPEGPPGPAGENAVLQVGTVLTVQEIAP